MAAYYSPLAEDLASGKLPWGTEEQETVQGKEKIFLVTDTSWWLEEGWYKAVEIAEKTDNLFFVIPGGVLKELDGLKKNDNQARKNKALYATKQIKELMEKGKGEIITNGKKKEFGCLNSIVDEEVISVAKALNKEGKNVIVLTTDYAQTALGKNEKLKTLKFLSSLSDRNKDTVYNKKQNEKGFIGKLVKLFSSLFSGEEKKKDWRYWKNAWELRNRPKNISDHFPTDEEDIIDDLTDPANPINDDTPLP